MNIKPLGALTLVLSLAGCQPNANSLKAYGTVELPESAAEVSLNELGGKWLGHWTNGERGSLTIVGDDSSALGLTYCYASNVCRNVEGVKFEGGAIRWSGRNRHYTFWLEGNELRGVLKEYSKDRWWTLYVWMTRVSGQQAVGS